MWTDYTNAALVYSCSDTWYGGVDESAFVLTREWNLSDDTIKGYENQLKSMLPGFDDEFV